MASRPPDYKALKTGIRFHSKEAMSTHDSAVFRGQNEAACPGLLPQGKGTPKTLPRSMMKVKFTVAFILIFAIAYGVFFTIRFNVVQNYYATRPQINPQKLQADEERGYEMIESFVKRANSSSVWEYLLSVNTYILKFRSPLIRENPSQYSWPETDAEKKQRKSVSKPKHIVWYNAPPHVSINAKKNGFDHCPVKDCVMTFNYKREHEHADAVGFFGGPKIAVPPRAHPDQIYFFYTMEPPWLTPGGGYVTTAWNTAFNWTWSYRTDSDIVDVYDYFKWSPSIPSHGQLLKMKRQKKKYVAWMSSHCEVPSKRLQYVKKLQKIIPVDIYGRCGSLSCKIWSRECDLLLNDYLFYLSFENSMCEDYLTEKFSKTFKEGVHVLPVARGGTNYSRYFPEGTFIDAEAFSGPEELGRYLLELAGDEGRYVDMLWRKSHFVTHEGGFIDAHCQVCYKLHHLDRFKRTYSDLYGWHLRHKCSTPKPF